MGRMTATVHDSAQAPVYARLQEGSDAPDFTLPAIVSGTAENGNFFRDEILLAQKDHNGTGRILLYTRLETPQSGGDTRMFFNNFLGNRHNPASDGSFRRVSGSTWV